MEIKHKILNKIENQFTKKKKERYAPQHDEDSMILEQDNYGASW